MKRASQASERAQQDYVKAIYQLGHDRPVSGAELARYLSVSRAAVTKLRRSLEQRSLVKRASARTDLIRLTPRGRSLAERMLRRHRLIETFLHRLEVPLADLHRQAEAIEHVISDDVAARLARFLGNPKVDPHGHPIARPRTASRAGITDARNGASTLADVKTGQRIRIASIPDRDAAVVRRLVEQHVLPGLEAVVLASGANTVRLRSNKRIHAIEAAVARQISVAPSSRSGRRGT